MLENNMSGGTHSDTQRERVVVEVSDYTDAELAAMMQASGTLRGFDSEKAFLEAWEALDETRQPRRNNDAGYRVFVEQCWALTDLSGDAEEVEEAEPLESYSSGGVVRAWA